MEFFKRLFNRRPARTAAPDVRVTPKGPKRTSWKVVCYDCSYKRRGAEPDCECCRNAQQMFPLSKYQATGGGTGFYIDKDGPLICSLIKGEWKPSDSDANLPQGKWHAPLFDFDYAAEWTSVDDGGLLVLKRPVVANRLLPVLTEMERLGFIAPGSVLITELADDAVRRAAEAGIEGYRKSAELVLPEVRLMLQASGTLMKSRTPGHHHFYLDRKVAWDDYLALMRAMADADLLEKDWVAMNERRRMAFLRKPGVRKDAPPVTSIPNSGKAELR